MRFLNLDDELVDADSARAWRWELTPESCASTIDGLAEVGVDSIMVVHLLGRSGWFIDDVLKGLLLIVGDRGA